MNVQRVGVAAMRGAAKPSLFFNQHIPKFALAAQIPTQTRFVATTKHTPSEGQEILAKQRLNRPISPHLGIYKMEQTWFGHSAWTRITGCTLSGTAYVYFTSYLVAPLLGLHIETASLVEAFASMPWILNGGVKFFLGFPFAYHFINGIRHLIMDMGKGFVKATITTADKVVWTSSILSGLFLAFGL